MHLLVHENVDEEALVYYSYVIVANDLKDKEDYVMGYAETSGDARFMADQLRDEFKGNRYRNWAIIEFL